VVVSGVKFLFRIASLLVNVAVALALVGVILFFLLPRVLHWDMQVVMSGSMEPAMPVGSVVLVRPVDPEAVAVGDIITFRQQGSPDFVTHRVVEVLEEESLSFRTRGDANEEPDTSLVPASALRGRVWVTIPYLGYVAQHAHQPWGFLLLVGVPGGLIIAGEIFHIFSTLRRGRQEKHRPQQANQRSHRPRGLATWLALGGIAALAVAPVLLRTSAAEHRRQERGATRPRRQPGLWTPLCFVLLIVGLVGTGAGFWASGSYALFSDSETCSVDIRVAGLEAPSDLACQFLPLFRAQLEWTPSPSSGVEGYRIYHRGPLRQTFSLLDEVSVPATTYDKLRPSLLRHGYFVTAFLQSSESEPSNTIQVHCRPALFSLPAPCHLTAENHHSQRVVELTWEGVVNATDYAVLRATTSGGPYDIVGSRPATTYIDAAVSEGVTYYYVVLALDADGNESDPSQEVAVPDTEPSAPGEAGSPAREQPTSGSSLPTIEYEVQPGDTLWDIATRFGTTVEALIRLNGLQDASLIPYGSTLNVPYVGEDTGGASADVSP
jgi:signal peptidase